MSKHPDKIEPKDLLSELSQLEFVDLVYLYIEAKTGDEYNFEQLPVYYIDKINEIGELINQVLGDKVTKDLFK